MPHVKQARSLVAPPREEPHNVGEVVKEREALEELIKTDGWRVFVARVAQEFEGRGYRARMKAALASPDPLAAKVVDRTADEITRLIAWPHNQVAELKGVEE